MSLMEMAMIPITKQICGHGGDIDFYLEQFVVYLPVFPFQIYEYMALAYIDLEGPLWPRSESNSHCYQYQTKT